MTATPAAPTAPDVPRDRRPEDERYPLGRTYLYGLQHIMTMYGGVIAPPLIVGQAAGLDAAQIGILVSAALLVSGAATILQTVGIPFFGSQLPLVQGISFASVSTMVAVATGDGGLPAVFGSIMVAGAIGLAISPFFAQVIRFFPPVVTGTIITVIGISLLPVAVRWMMGGNAEAADWGSVPNITLAVVTLVIVLALSRFLQGTISRLSILLGLVIGTVLALPFGMADFSTVGEGAAVALPSPFAFGLPTFQVGAVISMTIVVLVIMTETTADIIAVGEIVGTKVDARRVGDGLRADMAATTLAPVLNTFPASAFAQNVGLVAITGIRSRWAVAAGGSVLFVLGLLPVLGRVVAAIPMPVLGGAGLVLFGSVAASGIRTLSRVEYDGNLNLTLVAVAISFGVIPIAVPQFYDRFPEWVGMVFHSGISAASVVAVLLNILFNELRWGRRAHPSVFTAGSTARLRVAEEQERRRAEYVDRLDADRRAAHRARLNADVRARVRHGHGRRSGCLSALDLDADGVPDILRRSTRDAALPDRVPAGVPGTR
ncbi:nucleobase:cation symporter-2 family protein [uncultured Georgenia sp.]|uniref:nucleobase:cation symporter-2 family protein n=1 Tax=uncultured Georgenia sp. TaxID=378209 RepID=UPI002616F07E|nr:nucleobase:cation symporter-2 family protein [uncultured Georgenia sp.]HLV05307.1 nucleobase:cation symporter-2 family protein [Actinomycetaceae bacterium]